MTRYDRKQNKHTINTNMAYTAPAYSCQPMMQTGEAVTTAADFMDIDPHNLHTNICYT